MRFVRSLCLPVKVIRIVKLFENYTFIGRKKMGKMIICQKPLCLDKPYGILWYYGTVQKMYYSANYEPCIHYSNSMLKNAYAINFGNFRDQI